MADAWILFAFLSAIFAALTSIFAKIGIKDVDSDLATALRTVVVLIMAWAMAGIVGSYGDMGDITPRTFSPKPSLCLISFRCLSVPEL